MAIFIMIVKAIAAIFIVLLLAALVILALVLFSPLCYDVAGRLDDPEGSREILHLDMGRAAAFRAQARWLLGAISLAARYGRMDGEKSGGIPDPAAPGRPAPKPGLQLSVRILGIPLSPERLQRLLGRGKKKKGKKQERPPGPEEKRGIEDRIDAALDRIERVHARIQDALYALDSDYGTRAKQCLADRLLPPVERALPSEWSLDGILGLGDPARSAWVFALQGIFYPLTAGHICLDTDYDLYRYDLRGRARGRIAFFPFVWAGIRILLDRDVRRLLHRLRRGPSEPSRAAHAINRGGHPQKKPTDAA